MRNVDKHIHLEMDQKDPPYKNFAPPQSPITKTLSVRGFFFGLAVAQAAWVRSNFSEGEPSRRLSLWEAICLGASRAAGRVYGRKAFWQLAVLHAASWLCE